MQKPFKPIDEQIKILQSRNVLVTNINLARRVLQYENYYYVINGYKDPFINSTIPNDFYRPGTTFLEILSLYSFDRRLREIILPELLRIEHCVKARIIDIFSERHGNNHTSYLRPDSFNTSNFENFTRVNTLIFELLRLIDKQKNRHNAIHHYLNKYGFIPLWVLSKVMTFGKLNSFYGCMLLQDKTAVAHSFHLEADTFKALVDFLAVFRNKCAHGERIYCHSKDQPSPRPIPNLPLHDALNIPKNEKGYKFGKRDILALLIAMKFFLQPNHYQKLIRRIDFALNKKLSKRLSSIPPDNIRHIMGLLNDWTKLASINISQKGRR